MFSPKEMLNRVKDAVPDLSRFELPQLGQDVALPVYMVHNSADPEDYYFIFDFERFVDATRDGWFVRPKLHLSSGRSDFARSAFAKQFRESFAREFDSARAQLAAQSENPPGWFGYLAQSFRDLRGRSVSDFVANLVLLAAFSTGRAVLSQVLPKSWLVGKTDTEKLEQGIESTRIKVDEALMNIDITPHPELYAHAYRDGVQGPNADLDREAWPLPAFVRQHLDDGDARVSR